MRFATLAPLLLLAAFAAGQSAVPTRPSHGSPAPASAAKYRPDTLLVRFRPGTSSKSMAAAHAAARASVVRRYRVVSGLERVHLPAGKGLGRALAAYRSNPDVLYAEPDFRVHLFAPVIPNDPQFVNQWDLNNTGQNGGTEDADIDAPEAWSITTGSSSVAVGVIDTGVDYTHPDLSGNIWSSSFSYTVNGVVCSSGSHGFNAIANTCDPMDDNNHGTHVSGTIGASSNNNTGVAGINWNVTIIACKFLDSSGSGYDSDAITCLEFFKDLKDNHSIDLVATNNSWGGGGYTQALADAIDANRQSGILFIAAAGNGGPDQIGDDNDTVPNYPSNYYLPNLIAVAATDRNDLLAGFSNFGKRSVHLGAPGVSIISTTRNNTYSTFSGTSMATPHVTGVAALLAAQDNLRDWRAIKNLLLAGGDTKPSVVNTVTGKRLNANGSLTCSNKVITARQLPLGDAPYAAVNSPVTLAVLHINCAAPAGDVSVNVSPDGVALTLKDDGVAPDQVAGDGIYTGQFTPASVGDRSVSIVGGETFTLHVIGGYFYQPTQYNYRTISGTNLGFVDDDVAPIIPGFNIPFGGGSFSSLWVANNGMVSFDSAFFDWNNTALPTAGTDTLVAPFWTDLYSPNSSQNVFWAVTGSAPNRELVIEWRNVTHYDSCSDTESVRFQIVFFEDKSDILFNYEDPVFGGCTSFGDYGADSTVGVQVASSLAKQFSFNTPSLDYQTALLWTTTGPDVTSPVPTLTSLAPASVPPGNPDFTLTLSGSGFAPTSVVRWNGSSRPTTFINENQLTAAISAADVAFATSAGVTVFNFTGGESNSLDFDIISPGYALAISDTPQTVYADNLPAAFHGVATANNGYSSPVDLSCTTAVTAPPGTCTPAPDPVTPSDGGAALTLSASAAPGDYTFNLHGDGTDASTVHQNALLTLHVVDLSLGAVPNPVAIPQGTASNVAFTVTAAGTFTDTVLVACRVPLPAGVACGYSQNNFVPSNSGTALTLTISTTAGVTPLGGSTVHVDVTGSSPGAPTKTLDITLNVTTGPPALGFVPVTPCRLVDTRLAVGPYGGPALVGAASRDFPLSSQSNPTNPCGIPATAQAYSLNLTVVPHGLPVGFVTAYPCGQPRPLASNLNSDGRVKAVAAIVPAGTNGDVCIYASSATDLVIDIDGYFVSISDPSPPLAFYPVTPCRLVDTRNPNGPLGGPTLAGGSTRTFPLLSGSCGIPDTAQAYSLNYTVVPRQAVLSFLTTWPAGQSQPLVSTLNATTGVVTANAAIVPAGTNGDVNVYVTQNTDLVIDVNGYFAPAGAGGLSLYVLTPCRVLDTRNPPGTPAFWGQKDVDAVGAGCGAPISAQAFVLNATAVPAVVLSYLTLWPQGSSKPTVSTTNSVDGSVVSNLAIVPTTNGSISAYAGSTTHLVLDISAFFAP